MELKVWVEGIQRIVCGVTVNTTCQDVVFALAHATGKVGRFTLIERWRNNERLLAPNENPLKLLLKWGEYANDVQFILQRSEAKQQQQTNPQQHGKQESQNNNNESSTVLANNNSNNNSNNNNKKPLGLSNTINNNNNNNNNNQHNTNNISNINNNNLNKQNHGIENATTNPGAIPPATTQSQQQTSTKPLTMELSLNAAHERAKELKKSFGAHEAAKFMDNVGIVRGIPQRINTSNTSSQQHGQSTHNRSNNSNTPPLIPRHEKSHSNPIEMPSMPNNFYKANATAAAGAYQEHGSGNNNNNNNTGNTNNIYQQLGAHNSKSINEINLAEVRNALDRRTTIQQLQQQQHQLQQSQNQHNFAGSSELIFTTPTTTASGQQQQQQQQHKPTMMNTSNENLLDIFNGNASMPAMAMPSSNTSTPQPSNNSLNSPSDIYKQTPTISANGALVPPPYRDPPPPRNSPLQQQMMHYQNAERFMNSSSSSPSIVQQPQLQQQQLPASFFSQQQLHPPGTAAAVAPSPHQQQQQQQHPDYEFIDYQQINELVLPASAGNSSTTSSSANMDEGENMFQATQYNDLLQLIKFQREKINQQQMELSKYDAEIVYLENKERDQAQELEAISMEITKADQLFRQGSEQLQTLQYVEEENELVKQQEKTLKSEIALLRSKLANCETELLQCKNKIRLLMDDIEIEQRAINNSKQNLRQNVERDFLMEMERIQSEIDQAIHNTDTSNKTAESLKKEILLIENAIQEKKRQVEQLVNEMKEVNLQSLTVTTSEEIKHLLEGSNKPGSSRRIIGSPRQLENAVPTSKNPHGVWV